MADRLISVGVDFGVSGEDLALAFYEAETGAVAFYDSKETMEMLQRLTLVNEGVRVVTSFPSEAQARAQFEMYYKLLYRKFGGPYGTAWVRKGRRKTRRF